ncbi:putative aminopeptidase W07G4.4 [Acropora cervicornis]|uniref:Aminopeptidase W07G4.4 n=1 Tax=Acropora cervicornis TaxID=6130 RepID=A0AAD9R458_ACRCE|nr:putative aminopeptidase W07G4.4 [Acropora cervicornis]
MLEKEKSQRPSFLWGRDKCGAAAVAGFFQGYVADEIITSAAGTRVRVGNTDAEGRMAMADSLHYMKEKALKEKVPAHIVTIATLTGHAILAMGPAYSIVLDNGPAAQTKFAQNIQEAGHVMGDPFEISTLRREDYEFTNAKSEYADHGIDSEHPIRYSHFDIAGSSGDFPYAPTGAPLVAMATHFLNGHC